MSILNCQVPFSYFFPCLLLRLIISEHFDGFYIPFDLASLNILLPLKDLLGLFTHLDHIKKSFRPCRRVLEPFLRFAHPAHYSRIFFWDPRIKFANYYFTEFETFNVFPIELNCLFSFKHKYIYWMVVENDN